MATTVASTPSLRPRHSPPELPPKLHKLSFTLSARPRPLPDFNKPASPPIAADDVGALDPFLRSPVLPAVDSHEDEDVAPLLLSPCSTSVAITPGASEPTLTADVATQAPMALTPEPLAVTSPSAPSTPGPSPPLTPPLATSHLDDWVAVTPYLPAADDTDNDGWFGVEVSVGSLAVDLGVEMTLSVCDGALKKLMLGPGGETAADAGDTEAQAPDA